MIARAHRLLFVLGTAALLAGCSADDMIPRIMPPGADARAQAYLALFTRGQVDSAVSRLEDGLQTPDARPQLDAIAKLIAGRTFDSVRVIGISVNTDANARHVNISYQLRDKRWWGAANVAVVERGADWRVEGVSVYPTSGSLEELNRFSLGGKSALHYLWLALTVFAASFSIVVAVAIARARQMPKRWRWVLASAVGVGQFSMNWSTGGWEVRPLALQLFAAGFTKTGPVAPWILVFGLPLGAIVALWRWRSGVVAGATTDANTDAVVIGDDAQLPINSSEKSKSKPPRIALRILGVTAGAFVLLVCIGLWSMSHPAYSVGDTVDLRQYVSGRWDWTTRVRQCTDSAHVIAFGADGKTMTITQQQPYLDSLGRNVTVTTYDIVSVTKSTIRGAIRGESRHTDAGVPVVWDLVLFSPNEYHWHRTDWGTWGYTGAIARCPA